MASARWSSADVAKKAATGPATPSAVVRTAQDTPTPPASSEGRETEQNRPPRLRPGYGFTTWPDGGHRFVAHALSPDQLHALQQAAHAAGVPNLTPKQ